MSENFTYRVIEKGPSSASDRLLCLVCNRSCLRSNFSEHKKNKMHLERLSRRNDNNLNQPNSIQIKKT